MIFLTPRSTDNNFDPLIEYGIPITVLVHLCRLTILLALPQALFNLIGLTIYNAFEETVEVKYNNLLTLPFICIRIVTRGNYPDLIADSVDKNLSICQRVGLINFVIEVVTDNHLPLMSHPNVRQIVVPSSYSTSTGALYKARALQYALEDQVNTLNDNDWIVHLDEETLLTTNCLKGIINFISKDKHEFGQGVIYYTSEPIVNPITTIVDSYRVADDKGKVRFQFSMFFRPIFSWKGSYVVAKVSAEKDVSFDHGPAGSIAEDCFFSMIAYSKSYTFQYIEGEMNEKSAFTTLDYLHQRRRWLQGILLVVHSSKVGIIYKFFLAMSLYARMAILFTSINIALSIKYPLPIDFVVYLSSLCFIVNYYMILLGVILSLKINKIGIIRFTLYCLGAIFIAIPYIVVTEHIVIIWGLLSHKYQFHVVDKQLTTSQAADDDSTDDNSTGSSNTGLTDGNNRFTTITIPHIKTNLI